MDTPSTSDLPYLNTPGPYNTQSTCSTFSKIDQHKQNREK